MKVKVISLGLISSIIFSIVLAKNSSGSGFTTVFILKKKTKKAHKTTDEPVKVKGKGEYDPGFPDLQFIDEFDPMLMEIYKGNQTELDKSIISETNGAIVNKATGFLRSENETSKHCKYFKSLKENLGKNPESKLSQQFNEKQKGFNDMMQKNEHINKNVSNIEMEIYASIHNISENIENEIGKNIELLNAKVLEKVKTNTTNLNEIKEKLKFYNFDDLGKEENVKYTDEINKKRLFKTSNTRNAVRYAEAIAKLKKKDDKDETDLGGVERFYDDAEKAFFERKDDVIEISMDDDL
ncbi:fam-a protein, fragment [Plasmodium vinckei brucechwatti]|uniref:Fam-a protein n=1 Tax=Plasmodium vinckei brucechwatti TaxID=119398 RepID=A0A6V7SF71_PLAVN|nr:fam-a protein, fragment [Plasmodium vinckei brucechwatti]